MTLTPEKLDEIEQLAELAHGGPRAVTYDRDGNAYEVVFAKAQHRRLFLMPSDGGTKTEADAELCAALDPAAVRELVRLARIGLTSSGESGVQRGGRAIQWPEGINTAEMPEDGAV